MSRPNEYRMVMDREFLIDQQVRYDAIMMSLPEFVSYYRETRGYKVKTDAGRQIEDIWWLLKEEGIRYGIDKSLRRSDLYNWKQAQPKPPPPVKRKRGRPKKYL